MTIKFSKMHGLGNDFMVIDAINQKVDIKAQQIRLWADRNRGIGFDQCLIVEKSDRQGIDFIYRIFNADGQEVGQCGNGARCLALFINYYQLSDKKELTIATKTTTMQLTINNDDSVTVDFKIPEWQPAKIPLKVSVMSEYYLLPYNDKKLYSVHALSIGNPHAVSLVTHLNDALLRDFGPLVSRHPFFPEGCNAGFMEIINAEEINVRIYERGCGETQACGSGAVAAAAVARKFYQAAPAIKVNLTGGSLIVEWPNIDKSIFLTGNAEFVYEGLLSF